MMENPDVPSLRHPLRLEQLLSFRLHLLHAVGGAPVVRLLEGRYRITRREWRLLAHLAQNGSMSPSALATTTGLDRARTSKAIGSLTQKGLLVRVPWPSDSRRATVRVSASGQQLYDDIFPVVADIHQQWVAALSDPELVVLDQLLGRLMKQAHVINSQNASDVKADRQSGKGTAL